MPHLILQYSPQLAESCDLQRLCDQLNDCMAETGLFPLAGIRVRAFAADFVSQADKHPQNSFCALQVYMGAGRSLEAKQAAGASIMACAEAFFTEQLRSGYFALSLDVFENDPAVSWKTNSIHGRLNPNKL